VAGAIPRSSSNDVIHRVKIGWLKLVRSSRSRLAWFIMSLRQYLNENHLSGWRYPKKFEIRCYKSGKNRVVKIILRVEESTDMVNDVTGLTVE
jgi:hypothetical protein